MTDLLLALLPTYGLFIIAGITIIAALGIPLPSSIVALTSGGLAATGDLVLLEVLLTTFFAFAVGDQLAFTMGRFGASIASFSAHIIRWRETTRRNCARRHCET